MADGSRAGSAGPIAAVTCVLLAVASPAFAAAPAPQTVVPTYNAIDADTLKSIIVAQGQSQVSIDASDPQGPVVKVQAAPGINYSVMMDDCDGGQPNLCRSLEFRALLPAGSLNFAQINGFNETMRYATAYLTDKGVPQLRMDANLRGGVTADFIAFDVRIFMKVVGNFVAQAVK